MLTLTQTVKTRTRAESQRNVTITDCQSAAYDENDKECMKKNYLTWVLCKCQQSLNVIMECRRFIKIRTNTLKAAYTMSATMQALK